MTELAVFGSVARGEAEIGSDVDIFDRPMGLELVALADFLEEKLGCNVDLLSKKAIRPRTLLCLVNCLFFCSKRRLTSHKSNCLSRRLNMKTQAEVLQLFMVVNHQELMLVRLHLSV